MKNLFHDFVVYTTELVKHSTMVNEMAVISDGITRFGSKLYKRSGRNNEFMIKQEDPKET